jgi:hypothetical protein
MRELTSPEQRATQDLKKRRTIVWIIAGIMILSTLGYSIGSFGKSGSSQNKVDYKGITFELQSDGWHFSLSGINFITAYNPLETANISAASLTGTANQYAGQPLYFSDDSQMDGEREIMINLQNIVSRTQPSCFTENCTQYAIKNCTKDNIIIIRTSNETFINQKENCIFIYSSPGEMLKASDKFLFRILGIE